jgi:hypothetical protein
MTGDLVHRPALTLATGETSLRPGSYVVARVIWLVAAGAEARADYALARLLPFWQLTSEQDWLICAASNSA